MTDLEFLNSEIQKMDVPENRKDITKIENILWLIRNLILRNIDNDNFTRVIVLLQIQARLSGKI